MCPKNGITDVINQYVMNLTSETTTFLSEDSVDEDQEAIYPIEFLNYITPNGLPPHRLCLKVYASIIFCGLDPIRGICNDTRLTVKVFLNRNIDTETATGFIKINTFTFPASQRLRISDCAHEVVSNSSCLLCCY